MDSFSTACREGEFDEIMATLVSNKNSRASLLKSTDANGWNCLQWTAWHGHVECMKFLLRLKECEVDATDTSGRTALHIALLPQIQQHMQEERGLVCYPRPPPYEIVKMLLHVAEHTNAENCFGEDGANILTVAFMCHHLSVVKLFINCNAFQMYNSNLFWHTAATFQRVDCMRYLLSRPEFDPQSRNHAGWQPCFILIQRFLSDSERPKREDIDFSVELLSRTVDSPADTMEVYFLLLDCFRYKDFNQDGRVQYIFEELVKYLLPYHPEREEIVLKILHTTMLPTFYSLITLVLFERIRDKFENCAVTQAVMETYVEHLEDMKSFFLQEVFTLFSENESLYDEYIAEIVKMGWTFDKLELSSLLRIALSQPTNNQHLFTFLKSLILNKFNFITSRPLPPPPPELVPLLAPSILQNRLKMMNDFLLNVYVPLSNCVNAPIELMSILRWVKVDCHFNFNETDNCFNDYIRLIAVRRSPQSEVVSLRNLSRMSVRKYMFENFSHFEALVTMYSLHIPLELRQFLCYNHLDLKF